MRIKASLGGRKKAGLGFRVWLSEGREEATRAKNKKKSLFSLVSLSLVHMVCVLFILIKVYGHTNEISFCVCVHSGERETREKREREREKQRETGKSHPKKASSSFCRRSSFVRRPSFVVVAEWWWWCLQRGRGRERERERECCFSCLSLSLSFFLSLRAQVLDTRWSSALVLHRF